MSAGVCVTVIELAMSCKLYFATVWALESLGRNVSKHESFLCEERLELGGGKLRQGNVSVRFLRTV